MRYVLPTEPFPYTKLKSNITFGELQQMSFDDCADFVDKMRQELLDKWDEGCPPYIGIKVGEIKERFKKLKDFDISDFYTDDELYNDYDGFIRNFTKIATSVNQFFPALLKSRVNGYSIYDYLSNKNLWTDFRYTIVQKTRFDKMFSYSSYLVNTAQGSDEDFFLDWYKSLDKQFWFEDFNFNQMNEKLGRLKLRSSFVKNLQNEVIKQVLPYNNHKGFNPNGDETHFTIRYYEKDQRLFPKMFQVLRLGLGQVATNFPPLTARWIYEKYLKDLSPQLKYKVYDSSAGWGGRLLGSLCSNYPIHYIGQDVNNSNKGCYETLGDFYNKHTDGKNTFEIHYEGSEVIHQNKDFMKHHENDVDLVFTSPPYFNKEIYSIDKEQSAIKFPNYEDWLKGYLEPTLKTCYDVLKPERYCLINISDVKRQENKFYPLEQDCVSAAIKVGFQFKGKYGMVMTRAIGLNPKNTRNFWFDVKTQNLYKVESILIFHKPIVFPWSLE